MTPQSLRPTVVLVGHATLARGVLDAAEMILGPQADVHAVGMTPDQDPAELLAAVQRVTRGGRPAGQLLVLADLFGGSPANAVAAAVLRDSGAELVTGLNLPMVLEVLTSADDATVADLAATAARAGAEGVLDAGRRLRDAAADG
ncbi:MAG: mannose system component [Actinomycetota bacterium]|nr:mannose system component [Actinomycetota bacterium]